MARSAMAQFDKNVNGSIEGPELDACPGLKALAANLDVAPDGKLTADRLKARFETYRSVGAMGFPVRVTLDGTPLADAVVVLTPEEFMGGVTDPATGKTGPDGTVSNYAVGGRELPGLPPGVYRIAVTKDGVAVPERYNAKTALGCEVSGGGRGGNSGLDLKLETRSKPKTKDKDKK
ncbi:carboxypeptidase-like regulatory domain-containing protein [Gemmata sp.]|uniref:carboxypeptidase-like regulatory domain-containing protein n=1 Tax=Gemmata sp. TaxID=1914242 RepID=UPI003F728CB1